MSFSRKVQRQRAEKNTAIVCLLEVNLEDGREAFLYIACRGGDYKKMCKVIGRGEAFNPPDYGVVLEHGLGAPTQEVKKDMEEKYGVVHHKDLRMKVEPDSNGA